MLAAGAGDASHTGRWAPRYRPTSGVRTLAALSKTKVPDLGDVRVTVMGGGSFGLAMAAVIGGKGFPVKVLMRNQEQADYLNANHMSDTYIKGVELPTTIIATTNVEDALADCTYAIHAHNAQQPPSRRINLQGISIGDGAFAPEVQPREERERVLPEVVCCTC